MKTFMRIAFFCVAIVGMVLALAMAATAQVPAPSQRPDGAKYNHVKYDKSAEATIIGTVEEIVDFDCPVSGAEGNHVLVATAQGKVMVHVAPVKFMKQYGIVLNKGDKLTITGSKTKDTDGNDTMIARTITSEQVMISVRDPEGKPLW